MNHHGRVLWSARNVLISRHLLPSSYVKSTCRDGALSNESQRTIDFQMDNPSREALPLASRSWKYLAEGFMKKLFTASAFSPNSGCSIPVNTTFLSAEKEQLQPSLPEGRYFIRLLTQARPKDAEEETQEADFRLDLTNKPHVKRVLARLRKLFSDKEPGLGAASIVEALLQLHLSKKDVEAIVMKNRPLYGSSFAKKRVHAMNVQELIDSLLACNLTHREVGKYFKNDPCILTVKDPQGCIEIVQFLKHELKIVRPSKVLSFAQNILRRKVDSLRTTVAYLKDDVGMQDVGDAVGKFPRLLGYSTARLAQKAAALRRALEVEDIGPFLDMNPHLMFSGPAVTASALKWLVDTLGEDAAKSAITVDPHLLTRKVELYKQSFKTLRDMLPGVDLVTFVIKNPRLLRAKSESLGSSYRWLADTFGGPTAAEIVLKTPGLLLITGPSLQKKLEFVTGVMGRSKEELVVSVVVLTKSLERVLKPRFAALERHGLAHKFSLSTIFCYSNDKFQRSLARWTQLPRDDEVRLSDN